MLNIISTAKKILDLIPGNLSLHNTEQNNILFVGIRDAATAHALLTSPIALYALCIGEAENELRELEKTNPDLHLAPTKDFTMLFMDAHGVTDRGIPLRGTIELQLLRQWSEAIKAHNAFVWLRMEDPMEARAAVQMLDEMDYDGYYFTGQDEGPETVTSIWLLGIARCLGAMFPGETAMETGHPFDSAEPTIVLVDSDGEPIEEPLNG